MFKTKSVLLPGKLNKEVVTFPWSQAENAGVIHDFIYPPTNPFHFSSFNSTFPTSQSDPPHFVATDTLFTRASALPRQLPKLLTGLASVTALTPICNQSDVDLALLSQTDMSHSLRFEILHYAPISNPPQPLSLAFSTSPTRLQSHQSYFPLPLPTLLSPQHNWTFSLERSHVFLLLNLCSFSFFPWNTLAPFPSVQMLLISQVLLYKASKRPCPCPTKWTSGLLWVIPWDNDGEETYPIGASASSSSSKDNE